MGRYRAVMTETDREHISGESNPTQNQQDQAVYRVRQRINEELRQDIKILEENRPDVLEELRDVVCEEWNGTAPNTKLRVRLLNSL